MSHTSGNNSLCGTMAGNSLLAYVRDDAGCILQEGHAGPHEFVDTHGQHWQWETDLECDCEHCMSGEGDFCITYWKKIDPRKEG